MTDGATEGLAMADADSAETPLDEEAKRLKLEQVKAVARKAIAEAQKATLAAQLPSGDTKPLEGKVEVGAKAGIVAQTVAYSLVENAAKGIAVKVKARLAGVTGASVLVVEDRRLVATDWPYEVIRGQLEHERAALDKAADLLEGTLPKKPDRKMDMFTVTAAGVTAVAGVVGAAAGVAGMFRTDYSLAAREVAIGTTPLVAAVARELLAASVPVTVDAFGIAAGAVIRDFWAARDRRLEVERLALALKNTRVLPADRRIEDRRAELKDATAAYHKGLGAEKKPEGLPELRQRMESLETSIRTEEDAAAPSRALAAAAEALIARFDAFATAVTAAKPGDYPPLVAAALREPLHSTPAGHTHVLYVGVEASGGETITRRSLFGKSGQVGFMGGAQISYLLLEVGRNRTVEAGTLALLGHLPYDLGRAEAGAMKPITLTGGPGG
jgi:hypothetical protein